MRENNYQYAEMEYPGAISAAQSSASDRVEFVRRVYAHLAGSVLLLIGLVALLANTLDRDAVLELMIGQWWSWLVVMGLFMGAGFVARIWAQSQTSVAMQ